MSLSYVDLAVTVEAADAYAQPRGWSDWAAASSGEKTSALRRGQDYIAGAYNGRWANEWDNDDAPDGVKFAIIEAARRELVSPGSISPDVAVSGVVSRRRVGDVETEFSIKQGNSNAAPYFPIIDSLLRDYVRSAASVDILRV